MIEKKLLEGKGCWIWLIWKRVFKKMSMELFLTSSAISNFQIQFSSAFYFDNLFILLFLNNHYKFHLYNQVHCFFDNVTLTWEIYLLDDANETYTFISLLHSITCLLDFDKKYDIFLYCIEMFHLNLYCLKIVLLLFDGRHCIASKPRYRISLHYVVCFVSIKGHLILCTWFTVCFSICR